MGNRSIKAQVVLFVLLACSMLVIFYSVLVNVFYEKGLELSVQHRLGLEASDYDRKYRENPLADFPRAANLKTHQDYASLPLDIRSRVAESDFEENGFMVFKPQGSSSRKHFFVYSLRRPDGKMIYFVYGFDTAEKSDAVYWASFESVTAIVATGVAAFLGVVFMALWMVRRLTNPVLGLSRWATGLSEENLDASVNDFRYAELNELAACFRETMRRMLEGVRREQAFLRAASHELRTPIAVLQANLDWLARLGAAQDQRLKKPLDGMQRAAVNMRELVSTLLWVSRKDLNSIPVQKIQVDETLRTIIADNSYLLDNKAATLRQDISAARVAGPEPLARIVWSNIIRNAFQHCRGGEVEVRLSGTALTVRNERVRDAAGDAAESHGLGIMLIRDLTDGMGWDVDMKETPETYTVTLHMRSSPRMEPSPPGAA